MISKVLVVKNNWRLYRSDLREPDGSLYMTRWILQTPWFGIRLHRIAKSDSGRDFHDHPFSFVSLILRGGYTEHRPRCSCKHFRAGSVVVRKATDLHRLELNRPAWTLVFASSYKRTWGFQTAAGWVDYENYHRTFYGGEWRKDRVKE